MRGLVIHHYRGCGRCWLCGMGYTQMCRQAEVMGTEIHGGHSPYLVAPASTLVPLPDELSFADLVDRGRKPHHLGHVLSLYRQWTSEGCSAASTSRSNTGQNFSDEAC